MEKAIIPVSNDHPAAKNRYLCDPVSNQLIKLPSSLSSVLSYPQPPLLKGLLASVIKEPFKSKRKYEPSTPSSTEQEEANYFANDESVDSLVRRRLGPSVADNLVSAMIHGVYAADSRQLSVRMALPLLWNAEKIRGSIVLGMLRGVNSVEEKAKEQAAWDELEGGLGQKRTAWSLYGLKGGLGALTDRLKQEIRKANVDIRLNTSVQELRPMGDHTAVSVEWT